MRRRWEKNTGFGVRVLALFMSAFSSGSDQKFHETLKSRMLAYFLENTHSTSGLTRELALNNNLKREHGLLQRQVAEKLGIDEARISEILRGKIEGFTLDRLISYAEELYENVQVNIIAA